MYDSRFKTSHIQHTIYHIPIAFVDNRASFPSQCKGMSFFQKIFRFLGNSIQFIVIFGGILVVIYAFVLKVNEVSGSSMFPNFKDKEQILTWVPAATFNSLKRGDVVVFHPPEQTDYLYIKRIIGMPGDRVMIQNGYVYVNGEQLDESAYLRPIVRTYGSTFMKEGREYEVEPGTYFVMGDNREFSSDSRAWGLLDRRKIIGSSFFRVWPIDRMGVISNPLK